MAIQKTFREELNKKMLKAQHFLFHVDHSIPCYFVNSEFCPDEEKGESIVQMLDPQSTYIPIPTLTSQKFKKKDQMIEVHDGYYQHYKTLCNEKNKEIKDIPQTHWTGFLTFYKNKRGYANAEIPACDVMVFKDFGENAAEVMFDIDMKEYIEQFSKNKLKNIDCYLWFGNDPTYEFAGRVSSLGYYLYGFELQNAEIVDANPLTLRAKAVDVRVRINRPTRIPIRGIE